MMDAPGFLVMFLMLAGGRADMLSIVQADHYFSVRNLDVKGDGLVRLAAATAKDGPGEIARLLAIRTLGEKQDKSARATLEELARREKGFVREYAESALARIDGKTPPAVAIAKDSVRKDALSWFPADMLIFGAAAPAAGGISEKEIRDAFSKMIPEDRRERVYDFIEKAGNLRIDRVAMAYSPEPKDVRGRIMIRITGMGDRKKLVALIKDEGRNIVVVEEGDVLRLNSDRPPAFAFIGENELIIAGYDRNQGAHREVVDEMLAVRAGKKPSVLKGAFSKDLAAFSESAAAVVVGGIYDDLRRMFTRSPLGAVPDNFTAELTAVENGLKLRSRLEFASADDARQVSEAAAMLKKQGLDELAKLGDQNVPGLKPETLKQLRATLESLTFKVNGNALAVEMSLNAALPRVLLDWFLLASPARDVRAVPPAPARLERAVPKAPEPEKKP
jgi:hypothetical protein